MSRAQAKEFTGTFDLDVHTRKLRNGNRLQLVLDCPYDKTQERRLVDFRYDTVTVTIVRDASQGELGIPGADKDGDGET
jgi:hypothetical protein